MRLSAYTRTDWDAAAEAEGTSLGGLFRGHQAGGDTS